MDFVAYRAAQWLFRFPKRGQLLPHFVQEIALLDVLAPRAPCPLPRYQRIATAADGRLEFAGYHWLAGRPALAVDSTAAPELEAQLGAFFRWLHSMPLSTVDAIGLPADEPAALLREWRSGTSRWIAKLRRAGSNEVDRWAEQATLAQAAAQASIDAVVPVLLHADLAAEHVLLNERGMLAGIIDWGDALIGDPALDLAGVWHWQGERCFENVLAHYDLPVDHGFRVRARSYALARAIADVAHGIGSGQPEYERVGRAALRHLGC